MDRLQHLRHTLAFNTWANATVANALLSANDPPARGVRICAHIIGAEQLWLARLQRNDPPEVWPNLTASQCVAEMARLADGWREWAASIDQSTLDDAIDYVNSKGEPWNSTVAEIIAHVTHHAAYHRGQIAILLAADGHEPPYVDYIHAMRQGLI